MKKDIPVFERAYLRPKITDLPGDWKPPRIIGSKVKLRHVLPEGGPSSDDIDKRITAWTSPEAWHPEHDNDNQVWPLAKFLRVEKRYAALMVAERYRKLYDHATDDTLLVGKDLADNIFEMHRTDLDEATGKLTDKGPKVITGKTEGEGQTKRAGKTVPRPFSGDNTIINRIDARREMAILRGKLGAILDPFELAVVERARLEQVGNTRGIMSKKGAAGAGRALVDLGLDIAARHWRIDLALDGKVAEAA